MTSKEVLVVLGAPNSPEGELSEIAKSRLDGAASLYTEGKNILCTGGWGKHFNTAPLAHAIYARQYLLRRGIPEQAFLEVAPSANSVEDAVKSKIILSRLDNPLITIITSDFHLERAKLIFNEVLKDYTFQCIGVSSDFLDPEERARLIAHERSAMQNIIQYGLRISEIM